MALKDQQLNAQLVDLDLDLESLEISDFLDETQLSNAEEISNVMAASCTTCECCCSVSTALVDC